MSGPVASVTRRIDWQDTDAAGHYHHSTIIRLVEAAEDALHEQLGLPELFGRVPRVHYHVDYAAPLWFRDETTTRLWVEEVGRSSLAYGFEVVAAGRVAARGRMVCAHVDPDSRGSIPWSDDERAKLMGT